MSKLDGGPSDVLHVGTWLTDRAMRRRNGAMPAKEWLHRLDDRGKARFLAAVTVLENTIRSGRPPAGRAEQVKGSKIGLWELRVTNKGSTPPHLRVFYLRRGRTIWVASGITKQKNSLSPADIRTAESIAREWSSEEGSP